MMKKRNALVQILIGSFNQRLQLQVTKVSGASLSILAIHLRLHKLDHGMTLVDSTLALQLRRR